MGSSNEGDPATPGNLGSCDDYWQMDFCSLPTRLSFRRGPPAVELDPKFALAYAWLSRLYGDIGEFNASADYSGRPYEVRARTSEPEKYFTTTHLHIAVTGNREKSRGNLQLWAEAYLRTDMPQSWGSMKNLVRKAKKQLGCLRTTPSPTRPSHMVTLV